MSVSSSHPCQPSFAPRYSTVGRPRSVKRSRYLLEISGADYPDDSATTSDAAFLMEQIELREAVEACRQDPDGLAGSEKIEARLRQRLGQAIDHLRRRSEAAGLDPPFVASRAELKALARDPEGDGEAHRVLRGWRREFLGAELRDILVPAD